MMRKTLGHLIVQELLCESLQMNEPTRNVVENAVWRVFMLQTRGLACMDVHVSVIFSLFPRWQCSVPISLVFKEKCANSKQLKF